MDKEEVVDEVGKLELNENDVIVVNVNNSERYSTEELEDLQDYISNKFEDHEVLVKSSEFEIEALPTRSLMELLEKRNQ